jgi:hypothetical protein
MALKNNLSFRGLFKFSAGNLPLAVPSCLGIFFSLLIIDCRLTVIVLLYVKGNRLLELLLLPLCVCLKDNNVQCP